MLLVSVMCVLWLLLMLWFRKRIKLAIAITKEAARAVNDMKVEWATGVIRQAATECLFGHVAENTL